MKIDKSKLLSIISAILSARSNAEITAKEAK